MSESRNPLIAAFLASVVVASAAVLVAFLAKLYNLDAIIQMFNGVTQTQYRFLEDRIAALEGRLPGYENLERRVNSLLSGNTIIKVFNTDSLGLLTSNGSSNPVVLSGGKEQSMGQHWKIQLVSEPSK